MQTAPESTAWQTKVFGRGRTCAKVCREQLDEDAKSVADGPSRQQEGRVFGFDCWLPGCVYRTARP